MEEEKWARSLGDEKDDTAAAELMMAERVLPHTVWVNAAGRRFVNEASHNCALSFAEIDPSINVSRNLPAFVIGDGQYRPRYTLAGAPPGHPAPGSVVEEADTLNALAVAIGVEPEGLVETIRTFNAAARQGEDPDFGVGRRHMTEPSVIRPHHTRISGLSSTLPSSHSRSTPA